METWRLIPRAKLNLPAITSLSHICTAAITETHHNLTPPAQKTIHSVNECKITHVVADTQIAVRWCCTELDDLSKCFHAASRGGAAHNKVFVKCAARDVSFSGRTMSRLCRVGPMTTRLLTHTHTHFTQITLTHNAPVMDHFYGHLVMNNVSLSAFTSQKSLTELQMWLQKSKNAKCK